MFDQHTLPLLLKQLRLPTMCAQWDKEALEAEKAQWSYGQYLSVLSSLEIATRTQRRIQRFTTDSKLPVGKTLDTFNFSEAKSISAPHITALTEDVSWAAQAQNLIIFGPSGVGKTHLAAAIGYRLIEQGVRLLFSSTTNLVQKLQQAKSAFRLPDALTRLNRFPVIILDDIGYAKKSEMETSVLFELIAHRYETTSLIITANQPFSEWNTVFPDTTMAVAAIDRLVHHSTIINIKEESYRKKSSNCKSKQVEL